MMEAICGRWRPFVDDGGNLWKMEAICGRWRSFVEDGGSFQQLKEGVVQDFTEESCTGFCSN